MELEKLVHFCCVFCDSVIAGAGKAGAVCSAEGLSVNSGPGRETWRSLAPHSSGTITCDLSCPGGTWPNVRTPKIAAGQWIHQGASTHRESEHQPSWGLGCECPCRKGGARSPGFVWKISREFWHLLSCSFGILMLVEISCFSLHWLVHFTGVKPGLGLTTTQNQSD